MFYVYTMKMILESMNWLKDTETILKFIIYKGSWLTDDLKNLKLEFKYQIFGKRSKVESVPR